MTNFEDPYKDWDAAYVLGALSEVELIEFQEHLSQCLECSRAVSSLKDIPSFLGTVGSTTATTLLTDSDEFNIEEKWSESEFIKKLAIRKEGVQRKAKMRQVIGIAAAAIFLFTIGVFTTNSFHGSSFQGSGIDSTSRSLHVVNLEPQIMTATFRVTSKPWGTRFDWNCSYNKANIYGNFSAKYKLFVTDNAGVRTVIATWDASGAHAIGLAATTQLKESQIKDVEVTLSGSTTPLVRATV